jgi:ankyrin repeat protein
LLIAAAEGHEDVVVALLDAGAAPNTKNQLGRTALMFASSKGFVGIAKKLLARGADPNVVPTDEQGWTALMAAARAGQAEAVRALLGAGADVTAKDKSGKTALDLADAQSHAAVARILRAHDRGQ